SFLIGFLASSGLIEKYRRQGCRGIFISPVLSRRDRSTRPERKKDDVLLRRLAMKGSIVGADEVLSLPQFEEWGVFASQIRSVIDVELKKMGFTDSEQLKMRSYVDGITAEAPR